MVQKKLYIQYDLKTVNIHIFGSKVLIFLINLKYLKNINTYDRVQGINIAQEH